MLKYLLPLFAAASLMPVSATSPSIGLVKSSGEFRVDGSAVRGNGNIFEGTLVETAAARSVIQLADAQITLAPDSRARVYRDHTVLEKGSGFVKDGARHVIEAATLRIAPSTRDSVVQIEITGPSRVTVAARGGLAEVRNSSGILTARLLPGMELAFSPQAAADAAVKITGCESHDGAYFLTDETTGVKFELQGTEVSNYAGKKVEITGSSIPGATPAAGASQVVHAVTINTVKGTCKAGAAAAAGGVAAAGAAAGTAAAAAGGLSTAAVVAIVGGVAVTGTAAGLARAGTFSKGSGNGNGSGGNGGGDISRH
jgi:hypothetical protein